MPSFKINMKKEKHFVKIEEFQKKIGINEQLGLDSRDNIILSMVQNNPAISQEEIARKIKLSQPSVGARIRKLQQKGVLAQVNGVNLKKVDLFLGKVDVQATDTKAIIDEFVDCPFFVNALITSGSYNICLLFVATSLERLEGIINHHLRSNPLIKAIEMNIIISSAKDLVFPLNVDYSNKKQMSCSQDCKHEIDCIR